MIQGTQNGTKRVSVKIDQIAELVIINNAEMMINADVNAKN